MAGRKLGADLSRAAARGPSPRLRLAGRITAAALALLVVTLVGIQFARAVEENLTAVHELSAIHSDIAALQRRRAEQELELRRLRDPAGVIPEIHDRLRLVRPNEALIFVSPQPASPQSDP
jgi:cell division protein FtsB